MPGELAVILSAIVNAHNTPRLELFLQRIARHPTLQRATLVNAFFESSEWVRIPSSLPNDVSLIISRLSVRSL